MARGFYSVVQYVPDRFRAEAVNIGLVVMRLEPHYLRVRMTDDFDRACRLFGMSTDAVKNLELSVSSLKYRIETSADELVTEDDLAAFANSRANDLRLSRPRVAIVEQFDESFERLFLKLVGDRPTSALSEKLP